MKIPSHCLKEALVTRPFSASVLFVPDVKGFTLKKIIVFSIKLEKVPERGNYCHNSLHRHKLPLAEDKSSSL